MNPTITDNNTHPVIVAELPPVLKPRKEITGNVLSLHDAEMQLINSGPAGIRRLASARAHDMQELIPDLSDRDAQIIGASYVMLRMQGMAGALTATTRAEVTRLEKTGLRASKAAIE
jgi:hypothetical protein